MVSDVVDYKFELFKFKFTWKNKKNLYDIFLKNSIVIFRKQ